MILRTLPRLTIGLVGDLFLDRYLHLEPGREELSIETGREAYQIERVRNSPGAVGTVMNNLAALGVGLLVPLTAIGDDGHGFDLLREVRRLPVDPSNILCLPGRLTPTYTKPLRQDLDGEWRELNRLDVRTRGPLSEAATAEVCRRVEEVFRTSDALIVLDQLVDEDCGVVNSAVRDAIEDLARREPAKIVFVDSRRFLGQFAAGVLKGNRAEVQLASGDEDPAAVTRTEAPYTFEKMDGYYAVRLKLPFAAKGEIGLFKKGDELVVEIGTLRRHIGLPTSMASLSPSRAHLKNKVLTVEMKETI